MTAWRRRPVSGCGEEDAGDRRLDHPLHGDGETHAAVVDAV
jgi:hypothetical protein